MIRVELRLAESENPMQYKIDFRVEDNGIGIPERSQSKLFSPFYQCQVPLPTNLVFIIQNEFSSLGSGLGLYICKQLTTAMSGNIT